MGEQYFAARPKSRRRPAEIQVAIRGHAFTFRSDSGVFSGGKIDRGTDEEAPGHLLEGGKLWLVARTRQGADSLRQRMAHAFGAAEIVKRGSGFKVLRATKEAA